MGWTDARVEALKKHWADGLSCSQVATELGHGITRNAVIGKLHRMGITEESTPRVKRTLKPKLRPPLEPGCRPAPQTKRARIVAKAIGIEFGEEEEIMETQPISIPRIPLVARPSLPAPQQAPQCAPVTIMGLNEHTCHWPLSDDPRVPTDEFMYCGALPIGIGESYCAAHQRLAYTGVPSRKPVHARPRG